MNVEYRLTAGTATQNTLIYIDLVTRERPVWQKPIRIPKWLGRRLKGYQFRATFVER